MHQHVLITAQTASATDSVPDAGHTKQLRRCWYWVVQAYDDNQTQMTLDSFLSFSQRFAKIKSRRLQKAVAGITGTASPNPPSILCHSPLPPLTALLSIPPPPQSPPSSTHWSPSHSPSHSSSHSCSTGPLTRTTCLLLSCQLLLHCMHIIHSGL